MLKKVSFSKLTTECVHAFFSVFFFFDFFIDSEYHSDIIVIFSKQNFLKFKKFHRCRYFFHHCRVADCCDAAAADDPYDVVVEDCVIRVPSAP